MLTLTYTEHPGGMVAALVRVRTKTGAERYLCNPYADVRDAIAEGEPFEAHQVIGMKPKAVTINPAQVETAEDVA